MKKYIINTGLLILLTLPCSGQWKVQHTMFHEPVKDLKILDMVVVQRDLLYLMANDNEDEDQNVMLFESTDGGYGWYPVDSQLTDCRFVSFQCNGTIDKPWIISEGKMSKDMGKTWSSFPWDFSPVFIDENTGFAFDTDKFYILFGWIYKISCDILRSNDGGESWEKVYNDESHWISYKEANLEIINANTGWYINQAGIILEMKNGKWIRRDSLILNGAEENLIMSDSLGWIDISFYDEFNGWLSGYKINSDEVQHNYFSSVNFDQLTPILLTTNDGGVSWNEIGLEKFIIEDMVFLDENTGWAIGVKDGTKYIAFTDNGGYQWAICAPHNPSVEGSLQFIDNTGYILSSRGIYEIYQPYTSTNKKIEQKINVYPNPFTEKITISLLNGKNIHRLELIDITGKIVRTIENIYQDNYILERNNLYPGLYFLKIYSDKIYSKQVAVVDP